MTPIPNTGNGYFWAVLTYLKVCAIDFFTRLDRAFERLYLFGWSYSHVAYPFPDRNALTQYAFNQTYQPNPDIQTIATKHDLTLKSSITLNNPSEGKCRGAVLTTLANWQRAHTLDTAVTWESCILHELYLSLDTTNMRLSKHTAEEWDKKIAEFSCEISGLHITNYLCFKSNRDSLINSLQHLEEGMYVMPIPTQGEDNHTLGIIKTQDTTYLIDPNYVIATPKDLHSQAATLFNHYGGTRKDYSLYKVSLIE